MWQTIQVFYYDEARHRLIAEAIRPTVERLRRQGALDRFWLSSHWKRGPHLELHVDTDAARFGDKVLPTIQAEVGSYLARFPSRLVLDEAEVSKLHRQLAQNELEDGPYTPFQPDNSICVTEYTMRPRLWGGEQSAALAEQFYTETAALLFDLIHAVADDDRRRMQTAMGLMIAAVGAGGNLRSRFLCFRSHFEGFLSRFDESQSVRKAMEQWYADNDQWIARTVRKWSDMVTGRRRPDIWVQRYLEMVGEYEARFAAGFTSGAAKPITSDEMKQAVQEFNPGIAAKEYLSDYHRLIRNLPGAREYEVSPEFLAFRYIINLTYHLLVPLGVSPLERYFLCHAVAQAVEAYYGQTWREIVAEKYPDRAPLLANGD